MAVRAKFRLYRYEVTQVTEHPELIEETGQPDLSKPVKTELRSLHFVPVYSGSEENDAFFAATPSGSVVLGLVRPDVWQQFELEHAYYLDFTAAE